MLGQHHHIQIDSWQALHVHCGKLIHNLRLGKKTLPPSDQIWRWLWLALPDDFYPMRGASAKEAVQLLGVDLFGLFGVNLVEEALAALGSAASHVLCFSNDAVLLILRVSAWQSKPWQFKAWCALLSSSATECEIVASSRDKANPTGVAPNKASLIPELRGCRAEAESQHPWPGKVLDSPGNFFFGVRDVKR